MSERYPTDEELDRIAKWPVIGTDDLRALFDYVRSLWWMPEWGWKEADGKFNISTGGWSGNEDIIDALQQNFMFWGLCWLSSKRGGHFEFELKQIAKGTP